MKRRDFLKTATGAALAAALPLPEPEPLIPVTGVFLRPRRTGAQTRLPFPIDDPRNRMMVILCDP